MDKKRKQRKQVFVAARVVAERKRVVAVRLLIPSFVINLKIKNNLNIYSFS